MSLIHVCASRCPLMSAQERQLNTPPTRHRKHATQRHSIIAGWSHRPTQSFFAIKAVINLIYSLDDKNLKGIEKKKLTDELTDWR